MRFIDFFSGIGGFRVGMEQVGHKCVGFCELDKFATASYTSMHLLTEEQRKYLNTLTLKQRQKEILKEKYRNGEWYASDIARVNARSLSNADCWCFGAPCQDFSVAGKRAGLGGDRSSLIREIFRLLEEQEEQDRPEWLIYENVKGMLSSNKGVDYLSILSEMDRLGYDIEWQNINSKWFVPQNRERIYTIGHLRRFGSRKILPVEGAGGENSIQQYLNKIDGGGREVSVEIPCFVDMTIGHGINLTKNARSLQARYNKGVSYYSGEVSGVAIPVLTPDRAKKRQNGRRFKEDGEPMFTLTAQDMHGVGIGIRETKDGFHAYRNDDKKSTIQGSHVTYPEGISHCLGTSHIPMTCEKVAIGCIDRQGKKEKPVDPKDTCPGIYVEMPKGLTAYAVWYEKYQCYIAIRKLTPKECFRLQGWSDDYFEKAAFVNSDSQLYKQAGNGVTVSVVREIAKRLNKEGQHE